MSIGLYIVLAPLYLKSVRKLQEKRFVFVKILAIIIPENGAKVSKIKCFQFAQQTLNTYTVVNAILTSKRVEQQTYRSCMGLLKLAEKYSDTLLEAACKKALSYTSSPSYKSIKNILVTGSVKLESEATESKTTHKAHGITRGADYYRR